MVIWLARGHLDADSIGNRRADFLLAAFLAVLAPDFFATGTAHE